MMEANLIPFQSFELEYLTSKIGPVKKLYVM